MYGIFAYIWLIFMVNVGKYTMTMDPMGAAVDASEISLFFIHFYPSLVRWYSIFIPPFG